MAWSIHDFVSTRGDSDVMLALRLFLPHRRRIWRQVYVSPDAFGESRFHFSGLDLVGSLVIHLSTATGFLFKSPVSMIGHLVSERVRLMSDSTVCSIVVLLSRGPGWRYVEIMMMCDSLASLTSYTQTCVFVSRSCGFKALLI